MKNAGKWFLLLFIPLSLWMMIALPIYRAPDEMAHLQRAYIIADGQMISSIQTGMVEIPVNFSGMTREDMATYADLQVANEDFPDTRIEAKNNTATAIYPPLSYLPQTLGMRLAMWFSNNRLIIFYAARIVNWICTITVLWWGIRQLSRGQWIFLFLTLLPVNMQQMISASADGLATAIVFALTAFVLNARQTKKKFIWREYIAMALLSVGLVCWKVFYTPMVLLMLLIPKECFSSEKQNRFIKTGCIAGAFLLVAAWGLTCYFSMFHGASEGLEGNTTSMIGYLMQHPMDYFVRLLKDLLKQGAHYIAGIFGTHLSWGNVTPGNAFWLTSFVLCLAVFMAEKTPDLRLKTRLIMLMTSVSCVLIVYLMLYVWWTPMDSPTIQGFQGRYLLPLTLPVMLAVKPPMWHKEKLLPYLMGATVLLDIGFLIRIMQEIIG